MTTVPSYNPKEIELDGGYTADDTVYALEHIAWKGSTATIRLDRDVARFLADACRRHAARPIR
jgi:hypothetical protein